MFTKDHIIEEIKRTAQENGGQPLGIARFEVETGIKRKDWKKIWARWGDALGESGFKPNSLQGPRDENDLLKNLAHCARELGHFPTRDETNLHARNNPGFPWYNTYSRFGNKQELANRIHDYATSNGWEDVVEFCDEVITKSSQKPIAEDYNHVEDTEIKIGYV